MPKGPNGEKRPADAIGRAVQVAKIATGEIEDTRHVQPKKALSGQIGGRERAIKVSSSRRTEIAVKAANARWKKE